MSTASPRNRAVYSSRSGRVADIAKPAAKRINDVARKTHQSQVVTPRPIRQQIVVSSPITTSAKIGGIMDVQRPTPSHLKHHQPASAQTLMRHAVTRPAASLRRQLKVQTRTDVLVKSPQVLVAQKQSVTGVDPARENRANHTAKSQHINKFAPNQASWFKQQVSNPAVAAPAAAPAPRHAKPVTPNRTADIFQKALATATAHEQTAPHTKKSKRHSRPVHQRLTSVVAASLAVVLLAGFFAYQNKADLTMRFASAKAGFHANLPGYQPSGFASGQFHYSSGSVAVEYGRKGTSRTYTVSQRVSSLNSQSLLSDTIAPKYKTYQTLQQGGRTVYLYGAGNAAWVDNGVLYQITSNGNLSSGDILSIATSV